MRYKFARLLVLVILAAFCRPLFAQDETPTAVTDSNRSGDLPFSATVGTETEHVVITSGSLVVSVPITGLKGRGMGFNFALQYDSHDLNLILRSPNTYLWNFENRNYLSSGGMWFPNQPFMTYTTYTKNQCYPDVHGNFGSVVGKNNFVLQDASGAKHVLYANWETATECPIGSGWQISNNGPDGTAEGIWLNLVPGAGRGGGNPQSLYLDDGTLVGSGGFFTSNPAFNGTSQVGYGTFTDSNGNSKTEAAGGVDTLGRNIVSQQNLTNQIVYTVSDSSGTPRTYTVNLTNVAVATHFQIGGVAEYSGTRVGISSIVLPNGRSYTLQYNGNGEITQLTYPTGAVVTYNYATLSNSTCSYRYVSSRSLSVGGQVSTWTFLHSPTSTCSFQQGTKSVTVTDPLGNQSVYSVDIKGNTTLAQLYQGAATGTPLRQYTMDYQELSGGDARTMGPLVIRVTTQLDNGLVSKKEFQYDTFSYNQATCSDGLSCSENGPSVGAHTGSRGNVTEIREYDFEQGTTFPLLRRTTKTYLHDSNANYVPLNIVNRVLQDTVYDGSGTQAAQTQYEFDNYVAGDNPLQSATGAAQHDDTNHGTAFTLRGNLTRVKRWRNTDGALLTTTFAYDTLGNIRTIKDPLAHSTAFDYTDSFANTACAPPTGKTGQAWVSTVTNPLTQQIKVTRFPCTSLVQAHKDQNDINAARAGTTYTYDLLGRPTQKNTADGGQVANAYNDVPPTSVTTTTKFTSTLNMISAVIQDGLGRTTQSQLTSDPQGTILTDTAYDLLGRTATSSNPYRSTSDPTYGVTTNQYDALSRVTKVIPPDGTTSVNNIATSYSGNCTTVSDQAGKSRKSCTDGLGRLVQVFEAPGGSNYETDYAYDILGNLLTVNQKGNDPNSANWRARTFTYNSLSQLLTAANPESGAITYAYDNAGNLFTKTAPKPNQTGSLTVVTTNSYDSLNRLTQKSYNDGTTPTASYFYDQSAPWGWNLSNYIGRMTTAGTSGTTPTANLFNYDPMGRVSVLEQCQPQNCAAAPSLAAIYTYNLLGSPMSVNLAESGVVNVTISYAYDGAGRPTTVTSNLVDAQHPATLYTVDPSAGYFPNGALRKATLANGLTETAMYNNRLQPCRMEINSTAASLALCTSAVPSGNVLDFTFGYNSGTSNNGNVATWSSVGNQTFTRSYVYDALNRISTLSDTASAQTCKGLSWTIDAWGNRTDQNVTSGSCGTFHAIVGTNNRFGSPYQYDAAGNMTYDGAHSYTYDAENRLIKVDGGSTATYIYDAEGHRVQKSASSSVSGFLYDVGGNVLADFSGTGAWNTGYVYFGGSLIAEYANNTTYSISKDHLGSTRLMTRLDKSVYDSLDFLPFGEQLVGDTGTTHKFTGKERDSESGLDNLGARYDSSNLGRFMSPDPLMASATVYDPRTWNRYTYALNNPLRFIDPDGMKEVTAEECKKDPNCVTVKVNVIYDPNANGGKGLTDDQKKALDAQMQKAKDQYGDADIYLDVSYTTAGQDANGKQLGLVKDATNVIVSDSAPRGASGISQVNAEGYALTGIDITKSNNGTLAHELAHQLTGDTTGLTSQLAAFDPIGIVALVGNAVTDIMNDTQRAQLNEAHGGPAPASQRPCTRCSVFNSGARDYQAMLSQQAIRPRQ